MFRFGHTKSWLVVCLISIFLLIGFASAAPSDNNSNNIIFEFGADVLQTEVTDFRRSTDVTVRYYQEIGLALNDPVTIVLTRNRKAFLLEVATRFAISEFEANRVSKGVDALSGNSLIVINVEGTPIPRQRAFLVAHELTHQYQKQIAGSKAGEIKWMIEGMAEAVGAQIAARLGYMSIEQYKNNWQSGIRFAAKKPSLTELRTYQEWSNALSVYGTGLTYKTAGLSNLILIEQYGIQKIIEYFVELSKGNNDGAAFQKSFDLDLGQFERDIEIICRKVS